MEPKIVYEPIDVANELMAMHLSKDDLISAVRYAEAEFSLCTENDPIGFKQYVVYARSGRRLRELNMTKGWVRDNSFNQVAILHPELNLRIVPCNFDEYAGNRLITPTNRSPKGEVSRHKSQCNQTGWLPGLPSIEPTANNTETHTWLLGINIDEHRSPRAELSLPIKFDGKYFTKFASRIILLTGRDDDPTISRQKNDAVEVVDISVKRK